MISEGHEGGGGILAVRGGGDSSGGLCAVITQIKLDPCRHEVFQTLISQCVLVVDKLWLHHKPFGI